MAPSLLPPVLLLLASAVAAPGGSPRPVMALWCPADIYVTPSEESKTIETETVMGDYEATYLLVYPEQGFRGVSLEEGDSHRRLAWFPVSDCLPQGSWWHFLLEVKKLKSGDREEQFELQIKSDTCRYKCFTIFDHFPCPLRLHIVAHGPSRWGFSQSFPCRAGKVPEGRARGYFPNYYCKEFPNTKNTTATTTTTTTTTPKPAATHSATALPDATQDTAPRLSTEVVIIMVLVAAVMVLAALVVVLLVKRFRQRRNTMEEPNYHNNVVDPPRPIIPPRQRGDASQGMRTEAEDNIYDEIEDFAPRWVVVAGPTSAGMRQIAGQNDGYLTLSGSLYDDVVNDDAYLTPRPAPQ